MILFAVRSIRVDVGCPYNVWTLAVEHPAGCPTVMARTLLDPPASWIAAAVRAHGGFAICSETTLLANETEAASAESVVAGMVRCSC